MRTFLIDYLPESANRYLSGYALVVIDVIRATTMAVTGANLGHRCYPVTSVHEAFALAGTLRHPLLAGELKGIMPEGFNMNNSPAELVLRNEPNRPLILLSSSGTQLLQAAAPARHVYVTCLRNCLSTAKSLAQNHGRVAIIGAGSRGEFREEDQLCCAWVGKYLTQAGYAPENEQTASIVRQWQNAPVAACGLGASAAYLERSEQLDDLDFILAHVNDVHLVSMLSNREVVQHESRVDAVTESQEVAIAK